MATTTALLIRNRALTVVEALAPANLPGTKFRRYRNEGGADFVAWSLDNPAGALRRFQIRDDGTDNPPAVSNTDVEQILVVLQILVAYPQDSRAGHANGLDRDDMINADFDSINTAIGLYGRANFSPVGGFPDAVPLPYTDKHIARGKVCDILEITQPYLYYRAVS